MRIVSLLASATEIIAALGCLDQLVGRSQGCDYPPVVAAVPAVSQAQHDSAATSAQIAAQRQALRQISRVVQELHSNSELETALSQFMDALIETLGADRGCLLLFNESTRQLEWTIARDNERRPLYERVPFLFSFTVLHHVWKTQKPLLSQSPPLDSTSQSRFAMGVRSILCAPLVVENRGLGVVSVENHQFGDIYTSGQLDLLAACCNQAAIVIETAHTDRPTPQAPTLKEQAALQALSLSRVDFERLQQLQPDLILTQMCCDLYAVSEHDVAQAVHHLLGTQPRLLSLAPSCLAEVWEEVLRVGALLDRETQAQQLVAGYQARLERLRARTAALSAHPRVAILDWLDPLRAAGNWIPELVERAGGTNLLSKAGAPSPWLTWKDLLAANPEVIILTPCGFTLERAQEDVQLLEAQRAWAQLRAVHTGRVFVVDGSQYFNRPGPRLVESAELLATLLSGEAMADGLDRASWQQVSHY